VKFAVGAANVVRGAAQTAAGAALVTAGVASAPVIGPLAAPADALGTAKIGLGLAKINAGAQQMAESLDETGGSARNLLGLGPFGTKYDDPGEPTPFEFGKKLIEAIQGDN